jgi:RNA polymerase sigma-70 factor (ECF subfamily)
MRETIIFKTEYSYSEMVDEYANSLYKFCRSIAFSKQDAEDLFQETFLKALEQFEKVKQSGNPRNFLFATAAYIQKSRKRKFAVRRRLAPTVPLNDFIVSGENQEDDLLAQEQSRQVREAVFSLPDKLRIPVILYYGMELPISEIAGIINRPGGTVKSRLHKARNIIKKKMEE